MLNHGPAVLATLTAQQEAILLTCCPPLLPQPPHPPPSTTVTVTVTTTTTPTTTEQEKEEAQNAPCSSSSTSATNAAAAIAATAPPAPLPSVGQLIRITAAAGSGKTTTLLALAKHAMTKCHHEHVTYLTFTKAAANDGSKRLHSALASTAAQYKMDARTLHSCAKQQLQHYYNNQQQQQQQQEVEEEEEVYHTQQRQNRHWNEKQIKAWIAQTCHSAIQDFLEPCFQEIPRVAAMQAKGNDDVATRKQHSMRRQARDVKLGTVSNFSFTSRWIIFVNPAGGWKNMKPDNIR